MTVRQLDWRVRKYGISVERFLTLRRCTWRSSSGLTADTERLVRLLGILFSIEADFRPNPNASVAGSRSCSRTRSAVSCSSPSTLKRWSRW